VGGVVLNGGVRSPTGEAEQWHSLAKRLSIRCSHIEIHTTLVHCATAYLECVKAAPFKVSSAKGQSHARGRRSGAYCCGVGSVISTFATLSNSGSVHRVES
jgi:hypothetical protein